MPTAFSVRRETPNPTIAGLQVNDSAPLAKEDLATVQSITAAAAINPLATHVKITGPATSTYAVTLAAPTVAGQTMVIEMIATTGSDAVTLALTNVVGGSAATSASFSAVGHLLVVVSANAKWVVVKEVGVTLS